MRHLRKSDCCEDLAARPINVQTAELATNSLIDKVWEDYDGNLEAFFKHLTQESASKEAQGDKITDGEHAKSVLPGKS
jgi:hypothetical protein